MKKVTLVIILLVSTFSTFSQNLQLEKANEYLQNRHELNFTFQVNSHQEIDTYTKHLSILNFDPTTNTVYAWANTEQFSAFLDRNIPFQVLDSENEPGQGIIMSNEISNANRGVYPLTFPLTAYPTYADYASQMQEFANNHSDICELVDIGGTTEGASGGNKRLLFIKISDNITTQEAEPKLMYTSSMHGDEITGYPLMLDLIDYLITAYKDVAHPDHTRISNLINNSEVWINPMANPDGTYYQSASNTSVANSRRANANGIDLNRNYPDNVAGPHANGHTSYELETQHFMTLADNNHFVLSANFHGGTEVVNYPWDNTYTDHADSDWYFLISKEYAVNCQDNSPSGYMDATYNNYQWPGVTEGADWYQVYGGRQDYMNFYHQCKETTIELSNTKVIPANQLENHWNYNKEALIEYLIQGTYGFQGYVKDANTNNPIEATITLVGHDALNSHTVSSLPHGDFYRPVFAGTYDILIEAECYQPITLSNQSIANYQKIELGDIFLSPIASIAPTALSASGITSNSAAINWDNMNTSYDIRYREQGTSTWIEITDIGSNTTNLASLSANTTYEVQIRSVCGNNTSAYSSTMSFTTTNFTYCSSNGNDTSDEYIGNVTVNTFSNNSGAGTTATGYSDFTSLSIDIDKLQSHTISVTKFWTGNSQRDGVAAWIDFNQDGDFDDVGENIFNSARSRVEIVNTSFTVPTNAVLGATRLRVSLMWNNTPTSCEVFSNGEVEDYTVNIVDNTLNIVDTDVSNISVFPNPFSNELQVKLNNNNHVSISIYDLSGRLIKKMNNIKPQQQTLTIPDLSNLSSGSYFLKLKDTDSNQIHIKQIIKK
ncbi:M14 family zinc carboxypeptidase [Mangrovimonas spongiae]|uniref:T9SS C-terminal target domain-containing protein n=1 Tax=Mangrovimonas spongiae TaxID=2494697 RepID=A0A428K221_9FLAO|nr:M14 family zinc carboxypeptidase [Mangrovimonas spongiae]RSK40437.1 T9SS C-terminal target domain-containing protein [Mangrovimonas spongiae]